MSDSENNPPPDDDVWPPHLKERRPSPPPLPPQAMQEGRFLRPTLILLTIVISGGLGVWKWMKQKEQHALDEFERAIAAYSDRTESDPEMRRQLREKSMAELSKEFDTKLESVEKQLAASRRALENLSEKQKMPSALPTIKASLRLNDQKQSEGQLLLGGDRANRKFQPTDGTKVDSLIGNEATVKRLDSGEEIRISNLKQCQSDPTHLHFDLQP